MLPLQLSFASSSASGDIDSGPVGVGGISSPISIGGFKAAATSSGPLNIPVWAYAVAAGLVILWMVKR